MDTQLIANLKLTPQYSKLIRAIGKKLEPTLQFKQLTEVIQVTTPALPNFSVEFQIPMLQEAFEKWHKMATESEDPVDYTDVKVFETVSNYTSIDY